MSAKILQVSIQNDTKIMAKITTFTFPLICSLKYYQKQSKHNHYYGFKHQQDAAYQYFNYLCTQIKQIIWIIFFK